ncbi:MAG: hypothetical protein HC788_03335 [Sphingopyxis sp.]|nr:hypothetical protein [Sphingopyxis sp.]
MNYCARTPYVGDERMIAAVLDLIIAGGDDRIRLGSDGRNRYFATAEPFGGLAYGSSTISSISADALAHLAAEWHPLVTAGLGADRYAALLETLRDRLRAHYAMPSTAIVIAASGTDLEYVGLAVAPPDAGPHCAILLGRDEVGSGCVHSAAGRFFADRTATGAVVTSGMPIDTQHAAARLTDVAIRDDQGHPRNSADVRLDIEAIADAAIAAGEHPVIHIVHGSKTGLTLPLAPIAGGSPIAMAPAPRSWSMPASCGSARRRSVPISPWEPLSWRRAANLPAARRSAALHLSRIN